MAVIIFYSVNIMKQREGKKPKQNEIIVPFIYELYRLCI